MKRPDFTSVGTRPSVAAVALENHAPARILFCLTAAYLTASSFPPLRHHWLKLQTALSTNDITSVLPIRQQMSWAHGQNPTQGKRQKIPLSGHLALISYVFVISQQYHFFFFNLKCCVGHDITSHWLTDRAETDYGANVLDCFLARTPFWQQAATKVSHHPRTHYYSLVVCKLSRQQIDIFLW